MFGWVGGIESEPLPDLGSRGRGVSNFGNSGSRVLPGDLGPLPDSNFRNWMMSSRERVSSSESSGIRTEFILRIEEELLHCSSTTLSNG